MNGLPLRRCDLSDLPEDQCACRIHGRREAGGPSGLATFTSVGVAFAAQYPGRCPGCQDRIEPGELIRVTDLGYVHEGCQ